MPKFTNISTGDRGLYTAGGLVMVEAGQTSEDVEPAKNEQPNAEWFEKAGAKKTDKPQLDHDGDGKAGGAAPAKD